MSAAGGVIAIVHLVFFGVFEPSVVLRTIGRNSRSSTTAIADARMTVPRMKLVIFMMMTKGLISVAAVIGVPVGVLSATWPGTAGLAVSLTACVAMITTEMIHCRWGVMRGEPFIERQRPRTRSEKLWWCLLSGVAGTTEELTWRGVQVSLMQWATGSWTVAVTICCLTFAIGHIGFGLRWFFVVIGFAALLQWVTWTSGSLYPAMIIHTFVNVVGGLYTARLARTMGYDARVALAARSAAIAS